MSFLVIDSGIFAMDRALVRAMQRKAMNSKLSLSIRPLPKKALGECAVCNAQRGPSFWDSNLGGRICEDCEPVLRAAEIALVAAKCGHPAETLVFRNP